MAAAFSASSADITETVLAGLSISDIFPRDQLSLDLMNWMTYILGDAISLALSAMGKIDSPLGMEDFLVALDVCDASIENFNTTYFRLINSWKTGVDAFIVSYRLDREELISSLFMNRSSSIIRIKSLSIETHYGGQSVKRISLSCGNKLIYKPGHRKSGNLIDSLISRLRVIEPLLSGSWMPSSVIKDNRSWERFISSEICTVDYGVAAKCLGEILSFSLAFRGRDLHYENLILADKGVYLVDNESFFHPIGRGLKKSGCIEDFLSNGFFVNHIDIPFFGKIDTSFISSLYKRIQDSDDKQEIWMEICSNTIKSMEICISAIVRNRSELLNILLEESNRGTKTRVTMRPTFFYGMILQEEFSPKSISHGISGSMMCKRLSDTHIKGTVIPHIIEAESKSLLIGDVPVFHARVSSSDLFSDGKLISRKYFRCSAIDEIKEQLENLTPELITQIINAVDKEFSSLKAISNN
jgi:lantibiotic modifying enzyme